MHSTTARSSRSSLQSPIPPNLSSSTILHQQQQQQQHIIYGPVAPISSCGTNLHPSCLYSGTQRNVGSSNSVSFPVKGKGNSKWQSKNKVARVQQQFCQPPQQQHYMKHLPYNHKPVVVFDQVTTNNQLNPSASFLLTSSTFTHGAFPAENYNNSGITLIPQTYFKPPDLQTFCLVQDRQNTQPQQTTAYYNIGTTNPCTLQTANANVTTFQLPNLNPYANVATFSNNHSGPAQTVQSPQLFSNPSFGFIFGGPPREKCTTNSVVDASSVKSAKSTWTPTDTSKINSTGTDYSNDWPPRTIAASKTNLFEVSPTNANKSHDFAETPDKSDKAQDSSFLDDSLTNFDFTIEAEKMVSALCNTTSSNDLTKEDAQNMKSEGTTLLSGAGDNMSNKNNWFGNFCTDFGSSKSVATQTDNLNSDWSQLPELIRKTAYWGCMEAEAILNSNDTRNNARKLWLGNLLSATRTAITKSSTCFPIFAGNRVLKADLINALLRISNGWLILDNYLNKQHYPSFIEKLEEELVTSFHLWEECTHRLLKQITQTFIKLEDNVDMSVGQKTPEISGSSFPGDVSLYTTYDLFDFRQNNDTFNLSTSNNNKQISEESSYGGMQFGSPSSLKNLYYTSNNQQQQHQVCQKDTKLRSNADAEVHASSKFRARSSSSTKFSTSKQSLNAEFFHLRNKVMESSYMMTKQWPLKNTKSEVFPDNKFMAAPIDPPQFRVQEPLMVENYENFYTQKYVPRLETTSDKTFTGTEPIYLSLSSGRTSGIENNYPNCSLYSEANCNLKNVTYVGQGFNNKNTTTDSLYIGKSLNDQLELNAIPRNKMTLLSQIEPNTPTDKNTVEMTANLSAWFASIRNTGGPQIMPVPMPTQINPRVVDTSFSQITVPPQDRSKNTLDPARQVHIDNNHQLQTLQNMQNIQTAPWNACNLITNHVQTQILDEYDSSEDVRVYMKPGSYNVPKKRHQKRSNRRTDNIVASRNLSSINAKGNPNALSTKEKSSLSAMSTQVACSALPPLCTSISTSTTTIKIPFSTAPIVTSTVSLENSPRILKRSDTSKDVTWKAACASAEILLEALNVKESTDTKLDNKLENTSTGNSGDKNMPENEKHEDSNSLILQHIRQKSTVKYESQKSPKLDDNYADASSYEASEDDSGSSCKLSGRASFQGVMDTHENKSCKTNVKTDSWLISTLNNASIVTKQKRCRIDTDVGSTGSSNSCSVIDEDQALPAISLTTISAAITMATKTTVNKAFVEVNTCHENSPSTCFSGNSQNANKMTEGVAGKATYSETVRRSIPSNTLHTGKKEISRKGKLNTITTSTICNTLVPIPSRRCQRKDMERTFHLLHKSRKSSSKKLSKNCEDNDQQGGDDSNLKSKISKPETTKSTSSNTIFSGLKSPGSMKISHMKKKDTIRNNGSESKSNMKSDDRGWSVWYSSKRKQCLSPLALSKLEIVYQTLWQSDEEGIFKYPSTNTENHSNSAAVGTIEDYCKIVKSPMFLNTINYKLKNRVYHKVEHAVRDFRCIVYNSRLYHKNDSHRLKKIEVLSKKLEELLDEHFADWDFNNISGSPRDRNESPTQQKLKLADDKTLGRYSSMKKSPSYAKEIEHSSVH